jgi:hypothetical protein
MFVPVGRPPRRRARCLGCGARERLPQRWPINTFRCETCEDPPATDLADRVAHVGAPDHKRHDGRDLTDRLASVGFSTGIFRMPPRHEVWFGVRRDERITIARKPE